MLIKNISKNLRLLKKFLNKLKNIINFYKTKL